MIQKKDVRVIKTAIAVAVGSVGGWMIFTAIIKMFGLESIHPIWMMALGIGVVWLTVKLGINKRMIR